MTKPQKKLLEQIAQRVLNNEATPEEILFLQRYYDAFEEVPDPQMLDDAAVARLAEEIKGIVRRRTLISRVAYIRKYGYIAAAMALFALCIGFYFFVSQEEGVVPSAVAIPEILPGGTRATLTLANGESFELSNEQEGIITGKTITYTDGSRLTDSITTPADVPENLRLTTPRGGQYKVTLPDGSNVWLNAESTLQYPAEFGEKKRVVELKGEAFFEITKKKKGVPFIVKTRNQKVEVLGTQFNISAYPEEKTTKTTLVEGAVRVALTRKKRAGGRAASVAKLSSPGQQSVLAEKGLYIKQVDLDSHIGWRNGWFILHNMSMKDIMHQIERWYDVEVDYRSLPSGLYYGEIKRDETLQNVLKMIETISKVRFEVNGRRIMVQK